MEVFGELQKVIHNLQGLVARFLEEEPEDGANDSNAVSCSLAGLVVNMSHNLPLYHPMHMDV